LGLVTFLPAPLLSLGGGVMADRADRKRIVLSAQAVELACALGFAIAAARGALSTTLLFLLYAVNGGAIAFESPARQAVLPSLVAREDLGRAVTVMSTAHALSFVSGPALAGLLLASGGTTSAYACAAILLGLAWAFAARVTVPEVVRAADGSSPWSSLMEGFRFLRRSPVVLAAMTLDLFAVVFGGATAMLPVYAKDILAVGPRGYGVLSASLDVGAVATSLLLLFLPPVQRLGRTIVLGVLGYGVATIAFGLSRSYELSVAAYVAVGFFDQLSVVGRSALVQLSTPDELRGRVSSVNTVFILASNQLTLAESGFLAAMTSPTFSVVFGGGVVFVVTGVVVLLVPSLLRARQPVH
jgi:MFS family permease